MPERRAIALVDTSGNLPEKEFRAQVDMRLRELLRLVAANTTADGALGNRVTELEDAPPGLALSNAAPVDVTGAAADDGSATDASKADHRHDIDVSAVLDTVDSTRGTILSRGAGGWAGIDPGTAGHVWTSNGAGADPSYQAASSGLTQEQVEDIVAALIDDTTTVAWTYNDAGASLTANLVTEGVQDLVGAMVGHGLDYDDTGGTIDVDESELATGPGIGLWAAGVTLYEVDFTTLANNTLTGTESIDGHNWTVINEGNSTTFEILNGTGLHWDASTTNTAYNSSTQTATRMQIAWETLLGSSFDPQGVYCVDVRLGTLTQAVNGNTVGVWIITSGITATSNCGVAKLRTGGNLGFRQDGPSSSSGAAEAPGTNDVISLLVSHNRVCGFVGTWSSGWPAQSALESLGFGGVAVGNANRSSYLARGGQTSAIVLAASTGETGGTMDIVIRALRIRRVG